MFKCLLLREIDINAQILLFLNSSPLLGKIQIIKKMYDDIPYQFVIGHITISTPSTSVRSLYLILISRLNHVSNIKSVLNSKLFHYIKSIYFFLK